MISVRINNINDFQRVLTIAQARRSRIDMKTGARYVYIYISLLFHNTLFTS